MALPLTGRVALVTGVSRHQGIAYTVARRLMDMGADVYATGWPPHDAEQDWGVDPEPIEFEVDRADFADPAEPGRVIDATVDRFGAVDIVVAVHARSSSQTLAEVTADELDASFAVNVRSVALLARRFLERHDPARSGGRMIWFTSGQAKGPMPSELPYVVSKAALHQMTATVADALADHGIAANAINPGPVNTGYANAEIEALVAKRFPGGRWGTPTDVANLVAFLVSDEGGWIQGQVIDSEGGFRRG